MKKVFLFLLIFFQSCLSSATLWVAQNDWSDDWEKKYSQWLSAEVTPQFFIENQISTDCADAVIALRWIFSRMNALPAANTTVSGLVSHLSSKWDHLGTSTDWKSDSRFKTALKEIVHSTDTKTLFKDTYPIELNRKYLVPGALYMNATSTSGHAEWISKMSFDGMNNPITFYASTVPQQVRELLVYPFMKTQWPIKNENGFVRLKWVRQIGNNVSIVTEKEMPGYSLEQYQLATRFSDKMDFDDFVTERLIGQPLDGLRKIQNLTSHLVQRYENRVPVIEKGYRFCQQKGCAQESGNFYNHSTYSRDTAIQFLIIGITELIYSDRYSRNVDDELAGQMVLKWSQNQSNIFIDIGFAKVSLGDLVARWNEKKYSSNPNESIQKRWGF